MKVTNKLGEVPFYPENADQPIVSTTGPFVRSIAWFVVRGLREGVVPAEWATFIEDTVKPRLERVEGGAGARWRWPSTTSSGVCASGGNT